MTTKPKSTQHYTKTKSEIFHVNNFIFYFTLPPDLFPLGWHNKNGTKNNRKIPAWHANIEHIIKTK